MKYPARNAENLDRHSGVTTVSHLSDPYWHITGPMSENMDVNKNGTSDSGRTPDHVLTFDEILRYFSQTRHMLGISPVV